MSINDLLSTVTKKAQSGELTRQQLLDAYDKGAKKSSPKADMATRIIAYIGGGIVFLGLVILVSQNWNELNEASRLAITLGVSLATYLIGVVADRDKRLDPLEAPMLLIASLLLPFGIGVLLEQSHLAVATPLHTALIISGASLAAFLAGFLLLRHVIFLLMGTLAGTSLFYALTDQIARNSLLEWPDFFLYRAVAIGLFMIVFGYALRASRYQALTGFFYALGSFGLLTALFFLGGFEVGHNPVAELTMPLITLGFVVLGTYLHSRAFIIFGTIYLMVYILKVTGVYFAANVSWPIALVFAGLLLILAGYTPALAKKLITRLKR